MLQLNKLGWQGGKWKSLKFEEDQLHCNDARSWMHQSVILYYLESPCFWFGLFRLGLRLFFVESWGSTGKKVISHSCIQCGDSHPWVERHSLSSDGSVFVNTHWNTQCWVQRGCKLTVHPCSPLNDKELFSGQCGNKVAAFAVLFGSDLLAGFTLHLISDTGCPQTSCSKHFFTKQDKWRMNKGNFLVNEFVMYFCMFVSLGTKGKTTCNMNTSAAHAHQCCITWIEVITKESRTIFSG